MNQQEMDEQVGRTIREYAAAKIEVATYRFQLSEIAARLRCLAQALDRNSAAFAEDISCLGKIESLLEQKLAAESIERSKRELLQAFGIHLQEFASAE